MTIARKLSTILLVLLLATAGAVCRDSRRAILCAIGVEGRRPCPRLRLHDRVAGRRSASARAESRGAENPGSDSEIQSVARFGSATRDRFDRRARTRQGGAERHPAG